LAFLEVASGFSLAVAVCGDPSLRRELISRAAKDAARFGVEVKVVDIAKSYAGDFVSAVRAHLPTSTPSDRLALMLTGIDPMVYAADDVLGGREARPIFATRLNFDRERIANQLPFLTVMWMEREAFRLLLREAPDMSQWISARFDFGELPALDASALYGLMILNTMGPPDAVRLDLVDEETLVRQLEKSAGAADKLAMGRRIILLVTLGMQYLKSSKRVEARTTLGEALALTRRWKARSIEGPVLGTLGALDLAEGRIKPAIRRLRRALELSQGVNGKVAADASVALARAYVIDGDHRAAELCLRRLIESPGEGRAAKLEALVELGKVHAAAGAKQRAIDAFEEALTLMRGQSDPRRDFNLLMQMGQAMLKTDPKKALDYLERSLAIVRRIGDRHSEGRCLAEIGWAYVYMEEPRRAISYFEASLAMLRQLDDKDAEKGILPSLIHVLAQVGDFDRAELIARDSLERARTARNRKDEAVFLLALSDVARRKGETQQAVETARNAVEILRGIGGPLLDTARKCLASLKGEVPPPTSSSEHVRQRTSVAGLSGISRPH
jgi:tetratricopeptide (TPR) repeat protein